MPEIPNVVSGEPVESDWGNDIRNRAIMKYADATARDFSQPFPIEGELAWLDDPGGLTIWNGTAWVNTGPLLYEPLGRILAAPPGGVITRWNADGDSNARHFEWRRSASLGLLELFGISGGDVAVRLMTLQANGNDQDPITFGVPYAGPQAALGDHSNDITTVTSVVTLLTMDIPAGNWLCQANWVAVTNAVGTTDEFQGTFQRDTTTVIGSEVRLRADGPWRLSGSMAETIIGPATVNLRGQRLGATDTITVQNKRMWATQVVDALALKE